MRVGSSPDNAGTAWYYQTGRVRLARREGVREEPAAERLSREKHQLQPGGCGLGNDAQPPQWRGTRGPVDVAGSEVTVKVCGVAVTRSQGHSWAPHPSNG